MREYKGKERSDVEPLQQCLTKSMYSDSFGGASASCGSVHPIASILNHSLVKHPWSIEERHGLCIHGLCILGFNQPQRGNVFLKIQKVSKSKT